MELEDGFYIVKFQKKKKGIMLSGTEIGSTVISQLKKNKIE